MNIKTEKRIETTIEDTVNLTYQRTMDEYARVTGRRFDFALLSKEQRREIARTLHIEIVRLIAEENL